MREIKFRFYQTDHFWNKVYDETGDNAVDKLTKKDCYFVDGTVESRMVSDSDRDENVDELIEYQNEGEAIMMQYTGLKDKNGVEIYEGDIVRYYQPYAKRTDEHIVKWDKEWACFGLFEDGNKWCKENDWYKIQELEVIGNIYQNPELLNK